MLYSEGRACITMRKIDCDENGLFFSLPIASLYDFTNENERILEFVIEGHSCPRQRESDVAFFTAQYLMQEFKFLYNGEYKSSLLLKSECVGTYQVNGKKVKFGLYINFNQKLNTIDFYDSYYCKDLIFDEKLLDTDEVIYQPFILGAIYGNPTNAPIPQSISNDFALEIDDFTGIVRGIITEKDCLFTRFNQILLKNSEDLKKIVNSSDEIIDRFVFNKGKLTPINIEEERIKIFSALRQGFIKLRALDNEIHPKTIQKRIFQNFEDVVSVQEDIKNKTEIRKQIYNQICEIQKIIKENKLALHKKRIEHFNNTKPWKYYASICLLIKNENSYLLEWLDHYDSIGIDHFYIYDNGSEIPVSQTIAEYKDGYYKDKCDIVDWSSGYVHMQYDCYEDCLLRFGYDNYWIGFVDTDELIEVTCGNIKEFLKEFEDDFCVWVPWEVYNSNEHINKPDLIQKEAYTKSILYPFGVYGKVFLQPYRTKKMYVHLAVPKSEFDEIVNQDHVRHLDSLLDIHNKYYTGDRSIFEKAKVNHYITRSFDEWCEKIMRGSCDPNFLRKFMIYFNYNPEMISLLERPEVIQMLNLQQTYN